MSGIPETTAVSQSSGDATDAAALRQLESMPRDELEHLAEDLGIDSTQFRSALDLAGAVHNRRQLIAAMNRDAMLDVVQWGRRPVPANATKEQLALQIARLKSMRFTGLSQRGLLVLAVMRGVDVTGDEDERRLIHKLKRQEGFFTKLNRKRRAMIGSMVCKIIGDESAESDYQFLPPQQPVQPATGSIKQEIEESGLFGGLASRVKRSADSYLNQKMDEIELRIDHKLDEIDHRLAEWRDKEIANRLKIIKITLWASVIVAILSLIYSYIQVYFRPH